MTLLKVVSLWGLYETARQIFVYMVREQIRILSGSSSNCRRCQWRLFCTRLALRIFLKYGVTSKVWLCIVGGTLGIGNFDAVILSVKKLVDERRKQRVRQKTDMPGPRVRK